MADMKQSLIGNSSSSPRGTMTNSHGLKLAYREWTLAQAKPQGVVFIVHGATEHCGRYEKIATLLNSKGYEVYALDHQGHGSSEGERAHVERFSDYVDDVAQFVREMTQAHPNTANLPRFLMGHSMGALVVAHTAMLPSWDDLCIRGVILLSAGMTANQAALTTSLSFKSSMTPKATMGYPNKTLTVPLTHDAAHDEGYQKDAQVYHGALKARFTSEALEAMQEATRRASRFDVPLLMMHGTENGITRPESAQTWFNLAGTPDKTFVPIPGAYHVLHNEAEPYYSMFCDELCKWMAARKSVATNSRGLATSARGLEAPAASDQRPAPLYMPVSMGMPGMPPQMPMAPMSPPHGFAPPMPGQMPMAPMPPQQGFYGGFPGASPQPMMPGFGVPV